ncbi:thioredoxin-like protein CITRX, chloroplastic [Typha angustifolia]|uniref:thioredoxin-like protein CITRX, chloroplastic n=1 Tax=Typha angustifolia TaxID=59011 RepID=UPI003C2EB738
MVGVLQSSSFSSSTFAGVGLAHSSLSVPRYGSLGFPNNSHKPLSSSTFRSRRNSIRSSSNGSLVSSPPSAQYIREDYVVKKVSAKEVQEMVKGERSVPLVVDFYATWCGPCIMMAQELETLAVEYESNALFVKVDTDDEYEFARDMQVRGLPTLYFISPDPNKDAIRTEGLIPPEMIKNIIDNEM